MAREAQWKAPQHAGRGRSALDRYLNDEISAQMTIMYSLQASPDVAVLEELLERERASGMRGDAERIGALSALLKQHRAGCERIAEMLRSGVDTGEAATSVSAGVEYSRRLFDWSVTQSPEASVALYSLGSPEILARATGEIVALMEDMGIVSPERAFLEIGCGTGRFAKALSARVSSVAGVDVSAQMIATARVQCAGLANVSLEQCSGLDLRMFGDRSFDVVFAVDAFPYIVQSGEALVRSYFAETRRVLKPRGDFVIMEFSYREDAELDLAQVTALAAAAGFGIRRHVIRPLRLWDGALFHLV